MVNTDEGQPAHSSKADAFATTRWSIIVSAGREASGDSRTALAALCESYWIPLYGYVRRRIPNVAEAHDLTQAFFTELIEKNFVGGADPQRGRFRAYLLTALKNFLNRQWEWQRAEKRGGGKPPISLDFASADSRISIDPAAGLTPEQIYDREWALTLLSQILESLGHEYTEKGRGEHFRVLKQFLVGDCSSLTYADVAGQLEMTESAARMAVSRMRQRYRERLREEIGHTVASPSEIDDEIRNLFATLGG